MINAVNEVTFLCDNTISRASISRFWIAVLFSVDLKAQDRIYMQIKEN